MTTKATTDTALSPADVLRGQLEDILVAVPAITLARLDSKTKFAIFDWVEAVKEAVPRMLRVPPPPAAIKRWLRPEQLAGDWKAFTTWRPPVKQKQQQGLFA